LPDARILWRESISAVENRGGTEGFNGAVKELTTRLAEYGDFDALVLSSLLVRPAQMRGKYARWDASRERIEILNDPGEARGLAADYYSGTIDATSIHVVVFDAAGERVHEKIAGLVPIQRIRWTGSKYDLIGERDALFEPTTERLTNPEEIEPGIKKAFDPFLPADRSE